jgi:death-on-curing protein
LASYLDLADYLLIAEAVLCVPAETIARWPGIGLAESALHAPSAGFGGVEFYPELIDKAAVLGVRLARNHPLPDGNKPSRDFCLSGNRRYTSNPDQAIAPLPSRSYIFASSHSLIPASSWPSVAALHPWTYATALR